MVSSLVAYYANSSSKLLVAYRASQCGGQLVLALHSLQINYESEDLIGAKFSQIFYGLHRLLICVMKRQKSHIIYNKLVLP